jgi:hypothetical protein
MIEVEIYLADVEETIKTTLPMLPKNGDIIEFYYKGEIDCIEVSFIAYELNEDNSFRSIVINC